MLKNIFHLNHCTYGHVESRTLANLQGPRVIFNGLTGPKIVLIKCLSIFKWRWIQFEVSSIPTDQNLKVCGQHLLSYTSKIHCLWTYIVVKFFSFFCSGAVTPVVCRIIWDTPLIWGKAYMKFKTCFRLQWKNYRQSLLVCDFPIKKKWWKQNWVIYSKDRKSIWNYKK